MASVRLPCGCVAFVTVKPKKDSVMDFQIELNRCPVCHYAKDMYAALRRISRLEVLADAEQLQVDELIGKVTG